MSIRKIKGAIQRANRYENLMTGACGDVARFIQEYADFEVDCTFVDGDGLVVLQEGTDLIAPADCTLQVIVETGAYSLDQHGENLI